MTLMKQLGASLNQPTAKLLTIEQDRDDAYKRIADLMAQNNRLREQNREALRQLTDIRCSMRRVISHLHSVEEPIPGCELLNATYHPHHDTALRLERILGELEDGQ